MTHFISITKIGEEIELTGNLRIKEYLLSKTTLKHCDGSNLVKNSPFWAVQIEHAFQLNLISLNRNEFSGVITIDMVFDNPKAK